MALLLTRWHARRHVGRIIFGAVAVFGVADLVFALSRSFALSMVALACMGAADMISVVIRMTLIQLQTPDDMRGRVSAVNSLFVIASNQLGEFRAGLTAAWLGAVNAVLVGGVVRAARGRDRTKGVLASFTRSRLSTRRAAEPCGCLGLRGLRALSASASGR